MGQKPPADRKKLIIMACVFAAIGIFAVWLNFGRGGGGTPDAASLEAARRAATEVGDAEPPVDPAAPVVSSPSRPLGLGGR